MQKLLLVFILFFSVHTGFAQSADKTKMESERREIQQTENVGA
jgi:murein hydrolase activator